VSFAFALTGSVFPKACAWAVPSGILACCFQIIVSNVPDIADQVSTVGNAGADILGGFFFILGFLLVFRSQQAYARWSEGGDLMHQLKGEWLNAVSCSLAFCSPDPSKRTEVLKFQHQLVRLVSLLYASALTRVCTMHDEAFELIDLTGLDMEHLKFLHSSECYDNCEVVMQWVQRIILTADNKGTLKIAPPILSRVYNQLGDGIVKLNNAQKISEFPIPFPLAQMITVMLLFHWLITPLFCASIVKSPFWSGLLCFVVVFSYWSINYIATELEMPYGSDPNDLPLMEMQRQMNASLKTLMHADSLRCPEFQFDEEAHSLLHMREYDMNATLDHFKFCEEDRPVEHGGQPPVEAKAQDISAGLDPSIGFSAGAPQLQRALPAQSSICSTQTEAPKRQRDLMEEAFPSSAVDLAKVEASWRAVPPVMMLPPLYESESSPTGSLIFGRSRVKNDVRLQGGSSRSCRAEPIYGQCRETTRTAIANTTVSSGAEPTHGKCGQSTAVVIGKQGVSLETRGERSAPCEHTGQGHLDRVDGGGRPDKPLIESMHDLSCPKREEKAMFINTLSQELDAVSELAENLSGISQKFETILRGMLGRQTALLML